MSLGFAGIVAAITGLSVRAANQVVIFGVTLVAAHFLAPADFGIFAIASAAIALVRTLMYTGAFEYLLKALPGEEYPSECLLINIALAFALSGMLLILAPMAKLAFGTAEVGHMLIFMAPSNLMSAFAAWQESQILRAKRIQAYYGITAVSEAVAGLGAVGLLIGHYGLMALVGQIYLRVIVLLISYLVLQKPYWSRSLDRHKLIDIFKWSSSRYGSTFVTFMAAYGADFFLGALLSPAATGIYRASNRVVTAVADIFSHPTQILGAAIFSRLSSQRQSPRDIWPRIAGASAFLGWSALAGLAAIADRAVPIILGSQWNGSGLIIAILCAARALSLVDAVTVPLLVAFDKSRSVFNIQLVTALCSVPLLWMLARFGVAATAAGAVIMSLFATLSYGRVCLRIFTGSADRLLQVVPIALLPPILTYLGAWAFLFAGPKMGDTHAVLFAVAAGATAWLVTATVLRRSAIDALHALGA
ncbi:MAG TPA: oligosaccharide flippase family protein [Rhizomicrobium sp.]|nr:oligosaccharide flippase family protein [Rhizomicrobium sp.]